MSGNPSTRLYFAYGSNMAEDQMQARCRGAKVIGPGQLDGFRFLINTRGVASVAPAGGHTVHGLLWELTADHEATLDCYEGVHRFIYRKEDLTVTAADGKQAKAFTYMASDNTAARHPRDGYLEKIVRAAKSHALPAAYVAELESWARKG